MDEAEGSVACPYDPEHDYRPGDRAYAFGEPGPFRVFYWQHFVPYYLDFADKATAERWIEWAAEPPEDGWFGWAHPQAIVDTRTGEVVYGWVNGRWHDADVP